MSTVIVLLLLVTLLLCLAVVVGRVIATPDPWDPPPNALLWNRERPDAPHGASQRWPAVAVDARTGELVRRGVVTGEPLTFVPDQPFIPNVEHHLRIRIETPGTAEWKREHVELLARAPTLGEAAGAPLEGVPLRWLLRIMWAATRAGLRDAWRRLWAAIKAGPPL